VISASIVSIGVLNAVIDVGSYDIKLLFSSECEKTTLSYLLFNVYRDISRACAV
jgi:hypothetical protein